MKTTSRHSLLMTTVARRADALRLARMAVQKRLAACVQVLPGVRSVYRWKGKIGQSGEFLLLFKTSKKALPGLTKALNATHPYDLPELWVVPAAGGSAAYLKWVDAETNPKRETGK